MTYIVVVCHSANITDIVSAMDKVINCPCHLPVSGPCELCHEKMCLSKIFAVVITKEGLTGSANPSLGMTPTIK